MTPIVPPPAEIHSNVRVAHALQTLMQFARVVRYRRGAMAATVAASLLLGGLYYATAKRIYQAKASLLVLQTGADVTSTNMSAEGVRSGLMPTYERLFSSAVVLEGALKYLDESQSVDFEGTNPERWLATLRNNLSASTVRQTNIIEVAYRSKSPQAAVAIVNALLRSYLEFMDKTHKGTAGQIIEVITREKVQLEQRLAAKEQEVLDTRRRFGDLGIRSGGNVLHPTVQRAISLNEALVTTQQKRIQLQASQTALQAAIRRGDDLQPHLLELENVVGREFLLAGFGLGTRDAEAQSQMEKSLVENQAQLKTLLAYYGPAHPRVLAVQDRIRVTSGYLAESQKRIDQKLAGVRSQQLAQMLSQTVAQRLNETLQHEASLRFNFEQARSAAVDLNGDLARLEILEHDLHWLRDLRDVLLNQIASVDLRQDHGDIRTAVVSEPTLPTVAAWPRLSLVCAFCLLGGVGAGLGLVYTLDVLDDRFRSPEELRIQLNTNLLALVRDMPLEGAGLQRLQAFVAPNAAESEAFRTLRTTLALDRRETHRLVVSSAEPGDGKTTVLANLAVSFAQSGKRTLIIDADMRRPGVTTLFGMRGHPGLSDVLVGGSPVHEVVVQHVRSLEQAGLDILSAGTRRPDSAELLSSPRLAELLAWAETRYEQILIDTPPGLAASDASIVGRLVDGLVLVVQPKKNQRRLVMHAVDGFAALGVTLLGVVVNRIGSPQDDAVYNYGFNYGYSYEEQEEGTAPAAGGKNTESKPPKSASPATRVGNLPSSDHKSKIQVPRSAA